MTTNQYQGHMFLLC